MSKSQILGIRFLCICMGYFVGIVLFGTESASFLNMKDFVLCAFAGGFIGLLLTRQD